ncbi:YggS family pyridoxal phosphate-dependent enzyme [Rhodoblastus sp.]|uniref:YggS family pyridoxal phosphate-dependent enzyme n=1 Tax=Rhodoblastus sp. TaxID=1962975 RepID=UPI003F98C3BD
MTLLTPIPHLDQTLEALANVRAHMTRACRDCGRLEADVELVCVSKGFDAEAIQPLLASGERVFGENRVQEARQKWIELRRKYHDIELHLIGPLQSNKAAEAVDLFDVIETIDRPKIAEAIAQAMRSSGKNPRLLVQVNTGEEPQKSGVAPSELSDLLAYCRLSAGLHIEGLMCIPPVDQLVSPHFALMRRLSSDFGLSLLSMGMSEDFDLAIQLGATQVRVGSAIFGVRDRTEKPPISI